MRSNVATGCASVPKLRTGLRPNIQISCQSNDPTWPYIMTEKQCIFCSPHSAKWKCSFVHFKTDNPWWNKQNRSLCVYCVHHPPRDDECGAVMHFFCSFNPSSVALTLVWCIAIETCDLVSCIPDIICHVKIESLRCLFLFFLFRWLRDSFVLLFIIFCIRGRHASHPIRRKILGIFRLKEKLFRV